MGKSEESVSILYVNGKGGVHKTTHTITNAILATKAGRKACVVDMDYQGNDAQILGYQSDRLQHTVYTLMRGESTLEETLKHTYYDPKTGIFFDPANTRLMKHLGLNSLDDACRGPDLLPNKTYNPNDRDIEEELKKHPTWGTLLRDLLGQLDYDEFHIDTGPALERRITRIAFYAAQYVVIPVIPEQSGVKGLMSLADELISVRETHKNIKVAGIIFCELRFKGHKELMEEVRNRIVPEINRKFEALRQQSQKWRTRLEDLQIACFDHTTDQSADMVNETNNQVTLVLAQEFHPLTIQHWQCYAELLARVQSPAYPAVVRHINPLVATYIQQQETKKQHEEARRQERAKQKVAVSSSRKRKEK